VECGEEVGTIVTDEEWQERMTKMFDENEQIRLQLSQHNDVLLEKVRNLSALVRWVFHHSRESLMIPPKKVREGREARDKALCEINARTGAVI